MENIFGKKIIKVVCKNCGEIDEDRIEVVDISQGMQMEDRVKFVCPYCNVLQESRRFG